MRLRQYLGQGDGGPSDAAPIRFDPYGRRLIPYSIDQGDMPVTWYYPEGSDPSHAQPYSMLEPTGTEGYSAPPPPPPAVVAVSVGQQAPVLTMYSPQQEAQTHVAPIVTYDYQAPVAVVALPPAQSAPMPVPIAAPAPSPPTITFAPQPAPPPIVAAPVAPVTSDAPTSPAVVAPGVPAPVYSPYQVSQDAGSGYVDAGGTLLPMPGTVQSAAAPASASRIIMLALGALAMFSKG